MRWSRRSRPVWWSSDPTAADRPPTSMRASPGSWSTPVPPRRSAAASPPRWTWRADPMTTTGCAAAQDLVAERFTVQAMARALAGVYGAVVAPSVTGDGVMTLLVISPDYASHLLPLATLATAWRDAGERVVVASGPATAAITADFGFERAGLGLGRGSNPGVIRAENQVAGEDLRAPRLLRRHRARDGRHTAVPGGGATGRPAVGSGRRPRAGCWQSWTRSGRTRSSSTTWPSARGWRCWPSRSRMPTSFSGIPSALPVGDEVYGYPPAWPAAFEPDPNAAGRPAGSLPAGSGRFHRTNGMQRWKFLPRRPFHPPMRSPSTRIWCCSTIPRSCTTRRGQLVCRPHAFLGSAVRSQQLPPDIARWLRRRSGDTRWSTSVSAVSCRSGPMCWPRWSMRCDRCRCGWRWPSVPPTRPSSVTCRAAGWFGSSCRRSRCWSALRWQSPTAATTASPSR